MNFRFSSRYIAAALVICTVLTLPSCRRNSDDSANTNSPDAQTAPGAAPSAPATTSTQKAGVSPKGTTCPSGNPIKGITSKTFGGKIHITTKVPDYEKYKPEKCFPNVAAAQKAGYAAPK